MGHFMPWVDGPLAPLGSAYASVSPRTSDKANSSVYPQPHCVCV